MAFDVVRALRIESLYSSFYLTVPRAGECELPLKFLLWSSNEGLGASKYDELTAEIRPGNCAITVILIKEK